MDYIDELTWYITQDVEEMKIILQKYGKIILNRFTYSYAFGIAWNAHQMAKLCKRETVMKFLEDNGADLTIEVINDQTKK